MAAWLEVTVGPNTGPLDLRLGQTAIAGRVVDHAGDGIAGVQVYAGHGEGQRTWNNGILMVENERGEIAWSWFQNQFNQVRTEETGHFFLHGVRAGGAVYVGIDPHAPRSRYLDALGLRVDPLADDEIRDDLVLTATVGGALQVEPVPHRPGDEWRISAHLLGAGAEPTETWTLSAARDSTLRCCEAGSWLVEAEYLSDGEWQVVQRVEAETRVLETTTVRIPLP